MSFPWSAAQIAAVARLQSNYNGGNYDPATNPYGFGQGGHLTNFFPAMADIASAANATGDAASSANTAATNAATSETNAALSAAKLMGSSATPIAIGSGAKSFTTQAGKQFQVGGYVTVVSRANPVVNAMAGKVTDYTSTSLTVDVSVWFGSGTFSDWDIFVSGSPGSTGLTGNTGAVGPTPTPKFNFSSGTTDSDPGAGLFKINNTAYGSATQIYFDNLDNLGNDVTGFLDSLDDSTNTSNRGVLTLVQVSDPAKMIQYKVTSTVTNGTGYRKVPVLAIAGPTFTFTTGEPVAIGWSPSGDKGQDGTGAGTVINDTTSTDGHLVSFVGATGTHVADSGYGIGTSGHNLPALDGTNTWSADQSYSGRVTAGGAWYLSGDISPAQITADQNDYNPTGLSTASVLRLLSDASRNITGLAGGGDGRRLTLVNIGTTPIVLKEQHASSSAANRFLFGGDIILAPKSVANLWYDSTTSAWRGGEAAGYVTEPKVDQTETDVASAATADIGAASTFRVRITGSVTITSLGSSTNKMRWVRFAAALTLTHNATSLILPGAANIVTAAGDTAVFSSDSSGNWRCHAYQKAADEPDRVRTKVFQFTRAIAAASGSVPYTGVGFRPTAIVIVGGPATSGLNPGWGVVDSALAAGSLSINPAFNGVVSSGTAIILGNTATGQMADVTSLDADGFTLNWTKNGAPAAQTITFYALCFR